MRNQSLRPPASVTTLASLAFAVALGFGALPASANMPMMDNPLKIAADGASGSKQSAGKQRSLSKKAQRLKARRGGGTPNAANLYRDRAGYGLHRYGTATPPPTSMVPRVPRVPTFRAPVRRPAPRVIRRAPRLSIQRR